MVCLLILKKGALLKTESNIDFLHLHMQKIVNEHNYEALSNNECARVSTHDTDSLADTILADVVDLPVPPNNDPEDNDQNNAQEYLKKEDGLSPAQTSKKIGGRSYCNHVLEPELVEKTIQSGHCFAAKNGR